LGNLLSRNHKSQGQISLVFGQDLRLNRALELNRSDFSKGSFVPVVQRARRKLTGPRGQNNSVADAEPNLFRGKAAWSRRRNCINGALETPGNCEGFRMPALHGHLPSRRDGAGVRKPPRKETASRTGAYPCAANAAISRRPAR
jgi:hypothetical protein